MKRVVCFLVLIFIIVSLLIPIFIVPRKISEFENSDYKGEVDTVVKKDKDVFIYRYR